MRDPQLPRELFARDRPVSRECLFDLDDLARAEGASREGDAIRFSSAAPLNVTLPCPERDLSRFNQLTATLLNPSDRPLLAGLRLRHGAEDDESAPVEVSVSGGRETLLPGVWSELRFPKEVFGIYGAPDGWNDIAGVELLFAREKTDERRDEIVVLTRSLDGERREIPPGPRITKEGLTEVLDREAAREADRPGKNRSRSGPGDPYVAVNSGLLIPPPHPYPVETAEEMLRGHIMGQRLPRPIPWNANPLGALEWTHFLNRHHFLREIVKALIHTNDQEYAVFLDVTIADWIESNPVPLGSNGGAGPAWETLSVAWRLREWLWVAAIAWSHSAFRAMTRTKMLSSIWEHARSLMDHQGHPNNWIIVESAALALAGILFSEFREAHEWRETGMERLRTQFHRQFFPDGAHFEMSPLYHAICIHAFLEVKEAASAKRTALPREFHAPLEGCADYLAALYRPDFTWPALNDSGGAAGDFTALMQKAGEIFDRPDLIWIGSRGRSGKPPEAISRVFPDGGVGIMRSAHGPGENLLMFRAGPAGASHVHEDALSIEVTALGIPRLVDPGISTYAPGAMTDYYRSAAAHNVILIDGKGPQRSALPYREKTRSARSSFFYSGNEALEVATGVCSGPWPHIDGELDLVTTIIFVRPEYWIVRDLIVGEGIREVTGCRQFFPGRVEIDIETLAARCTDARGPGFELIPLVGSLSLEIEQFTGAMGPPRGWVSIDGSDFPGTAFRYNVKGTLPLCLIWILLPFSGRPFSGLQATRVDEEAGETSLEIRSTDGRLDLFTLVRPTKEDILASGDRVHGRIRLKRSHRDGGAFETKLPR